jgi:hypothetical protein
MPESSGEEVEANESWVAPSQESEGAGDEAHTGPAAHRHLTAAEGNEEREWLSDHTVAGQEEPAAEEETRFKEESGQAHRDFGLGENDVSEDNEDSGKVSWFSSFRRNKKSKQTEEAEEAATETLAQGSAEPIPFPRASFPSAQQGTETIEEQHAIDAARQAVRSVFSSLGHGRSIATTAMAEDDGAPAPGPAQTNNGRAERFAEASDRLKRASDAGGNWGLSEKKDEASDDRDPDVALREAMWAHFLSPDKRTNDAPSLPAEELAEKLETHLKSAAATAKNEQTRPGGITGLWGKSSRSADEEFEPEPTVVEEPVEDRDDDTAFDQRLYREIEETQEKSGEVPRRGRRGGLALAAAWGLFLCVASGLVAGFFAFRETIADAVPGLSPLYRSLGMPVTVQPLVFESVRYGWSTSDNRPVLTVSGSVFNRAHRSVPVPQFFITVKDQDPTLDRDYPVKLKVNSRKISSNERADFDIELVSPNPTVTAVELELRNVH